MKRLLTILTICLFIGVFIPVQASPIVEISVNDTWTYEGTETYTYDVLDKQDFLSGETYVELTQISSNEVIQVSSPSIINVTDKWLGTDVSLYLDVIFTTHDRWHTSRGNFEAITEKTGTFNLTKHIDNDTTYHSGDVHMIRYYSDFDLQSPIVTGNPIYSERITLWKLNPINITFYDTTTYRIDGTDEWETIYKATPTLVRNVTVVPTERNFYSWGGDFTIEGNKSVVGMKQYLWVFANDIGIPIYKQITYVQPISAMKLAVFGETYDLADHSILLSTWSEEEPTTTEPTETTSLQLSILSLMMVTYVFFYIKKKRP